MSPAQTRSFVYPRLFGLHALPPGTATTANGAPFSFPPPLNLSAESIASEGVYLLDDSLSLLVWVGAAADPALCNSLFDADERGELSLKPDPGETESPLGKTRSIVRELRATRPPFLALDICREGDPQKQPVFFRHLARRPSRESPKLSKRQRPSSMTFCSVGTVACRPLEGPGPTGSVRARAGRGSRELRGRAVLLLGVHGPHPAPRLAAGWSMLPSPMPLPSYRSVLTFSFSKARARDH